MNAFCKLKSGEIMVIFSDNTEEETMHVFPLSELDEAGRYDVESLSCSEVRYNEVAVTDMNLSLLQGLQQTEKAGHKSAILRYGNETIMTGNASSLRVIFNNLTGKNFEDPEEYRRYLLMMECELDLPHMDIEKLSVEEV